MTTSPLAAVVAAYTVQRERTLALPRLGMPGCARHSTKVAALPEPEIGEIVTRTKDPNILCVEAVDPDGVVMLVPIAGPYSWPKGAAHARQLVRSGIHPLDIVVATLSMETLEQPEQSFQFRTAIDHLFWTADDQKKLEQELKDGAPKEA